MTDHTLVEPFEIDNGELDGLRAQECFALGVEWAMFRDRLRTGRPFTLLVLANNAERLTKPAERSRRYVENRPASDGWAEISVGDYITECEQP